jgi:CHAD domain-containing protein
MSAADEIELDRTATVADAIRVAVRASVERLFEHEAGVLSGEDPEDVHQARVATRRLRSDLRTFHDFVDTNWANDLRAELQWLGSELGEVRDIEVMLARLRADTARLPDADRESAERVTRRLVADWHAARDHMVAQVSGARYVALRASLVAAAERPRCTVWAHLPAVDVLPKVVRKPWRKLRDAVRDLGPAPADEALHEVRIRAKRARYAAEATAPVFGQVARRFARGMAAVQDVLGEHQDAIVARAWLTKTATECSPNEAFAAGMLAAMQLQTAAAARERFPDVWDDARSKKRRAWL